MSSIINKRAVKFPTTRTGPYNNLFDVWIIIVENHGDIKGFADLLELIYGEQVKVRQRNFSEVLILLPINPGRTLVGVRFAAKICRVNYRISNREDWY